MNRMIADFFENREIFITGGSGVVGKALIEKLLRSCNVHTIFLLLRPKRNQNIEQRLQKIKESMIFRRLHKEKPQEFDKKIIAIPGDAKLYLLGMTSEHLKLMENVSVVYHGAATVRFDEPLRDAIKLNLGGTFEALKFAETLKQLVLFMHVSTFYSNPYLKFIEPKLYESPMDWKFCLDLSKRTDLSEQMFDALTKKLIVGFPNTYCFTKNLAESLVNEYRNKFPVCIHRPSIIVFANDEPEPGYAPAMMGAMGLFAMYSAGLNRAIYIAKNHRLDFVPQDVVVKSMLYYTPKAASIYLESKPDEAPIYHSCICTHNNTTLEKFISLIDENEIYIETASYKNLWIPKLKFTDNRLLYVFLVLLTQIMPSLLVDFLLLLCGRKPELMKAQRTLWTTLKTMEPFLFNEFDSAGCTYAKEMVEELDGTAFSQDCLKFCGKSSYDISVTGKMMYGVREFLFKEDPQTLPRARVIMKTKIFLGRILQVFLAYKAFQKILQILTNWYF